MEPHILSVKLDEFYSASHTGQ